MSHPKLAAPPIVEVVCGVFFAPIPELDPVILGKFWHDLRGDYPLHAIQPPVMDGFMLGAVGAWNPARPHGPVAPGARRSPLRRPRSSASACSTPSRARTRGTSWRS